MADNVVLEYLDLVSQSRNTGQPSFFQLKNSFASSRQFGPPSPTSLQTALSVPSLNRSGSNLISESPIDLAFCSSSSEDDLRTLLPIHEILLEIQEAAKRCDAKFFEPFILHYWQLQRLLDAVRCNTKVLALPAQQRACDVKINKLREDISEESLSSKRQTMETKLRELERKKQAIQAELSYERDALKQGLRDKEKDNIQSVVVLSSLLNVVFRQGMSVALISDQLQLEPQLKECRDLLSDCCNIKFDDRFNDTFSRHHRVHTTATIFERLTLELRNQLSTAFGENNLHDDTVDLGHEDQRLVSARNHASRVLGAQEFHAICNHFRLGGTRSRRLLVFLERFLQNETYSAVFETIDPCMRNLLAYVNWIFFVPRISLNFSLLYHHVFNLSKLEPLEQKVDAWVRLRAHWTRFWFEVINDTYWILMGLKVCFWLPGGVLSPLGIYLSLTVQFLDLFCSITRAFIELYRLHKMSSDLISLDYNFAFKEDLDKRFWFEAFALGYMVCHFSILMLSLCLTLPSMAAVSTMWPVVGGACAVTLTFVTYYMQIYFTQRRQAEFEPRPKPLLPEAEELLRLPSMNYQ